MSKHGLATCIEVALNHQGFICEKVRHAICRHERIGDSPVEVRHQFGLGDRWQPAAIQEYYKAGIRIVIITCDYTFTAQRNRRIPG